MALHLMCESSLAKLSIHNCYRTNVNSFFLYVLLYEYIHINYMLA